MTIHLYPDVHRTLGTDLAKRPFLRDWLSAAMLTLYLATTLALICWLSGAWQAKPYMRFFEKPGSELLLEKLPTVAFQQVLLQWFLVPILIRIFSRRWTVAFCGASIFSLLHLPNPILMALTFIAGVSWIIYYDSRKRFAPLIASHFVLAILASSFCGEYIFHMRVGPSCVKLFPRILGQFAMPGFELPGCVNGSLDSVTEVGSKTQLEGWIADPNHDTPPQALYVELTNRLVPLSDLTFDRPSNNELASESSNEMKNRYHFRAVMGKGDMPKSGQASIWVKNVNGWYCALGDHQSFAIYIPEAPNENPVPSRQELFQEVRQASAIEGLDEPEFK